MVHGQLADATEDIVANEDTGSSFRCSIVADRAVVDRYATDRMDPAANRGLIVAYRALADDSA
jgi:hypothetical protein